MGPGVDGTAARSGGAAAVGQLPRGTGRIPLLDELARSIPVGMQLTTGPAATRDINLFPSPSTDGLLIGGRGVG